MVTVNVNAAPKATVAAERRGLSGGVAARHGCRILCRRAAYAAVIICGAAGQ